MKRKGALKIILKGQIKIIENDIFKNLIKIANFVVSFFTENKFKNK